MLALACPRQATSFTIPNHTAWSWTSKQIDVPVAVVVVGAVGVLVVQRCPSTMPFLAPDACLSPRSLPSIGRCLGNTEVESLPPSLFLNHPPIHETGALAPAPNCHPKLDAIPESGILCVISLAFAPPTASLSVRRRRLRIQLGNLSLELWKPSDPQLYRDHRDSSVSRRLCKQ